MGLIATVTGIEWDLVPKPASVRCDLCGDYFAAGRKFMPHAERNQLGNALRAEGWWVQGDHEHHLCPECVGGGGVSVFLKLLEERRNDV
jgi:hypothetical protein